MRLVAATARLSVVSRVLILKALRRGETPEGLYRGEHCSCRCLSESCVGCIVMRLPARPVAEVWLIFEDVGW